MNAESVTKYSPVSKFFHWVMAFAIIGMLCVGFFLNDFPEQYVGTAYLLHKSTGLSILALVFLRFIWVHASGKPPLPATIKLYEKILSRFIQYGFYVLMVLMPLSGWILSMAEGRLPTFFGLFNLPLPGISKNEHLATLMSQSHEVMAWIFIVFLCLHVLGALKHHFIDRDTVLKSML